MTVRALSFVAALAIVVSGCAQRENEKPYERGKRLFDEGKWDAAINSLTVAIEKNPLDSEARLFRGRAYHCQGREYLSLAIIDFDEAIRLSPNNCEAYYSRAQAYKERGDRQKSLEDSLTARRLDPNYASASNAFSGPSTGAYNEMLKRATISETTAPTSNVSTDKLLESAIDDLPVPSRLGGESPPEKAAPKTTSQEPASRGHGTAASDLRDAYGLPLSTERPGSVTEELFGTGKKVAGGNAGTPASRFPSLGPSWPIQQQLGQESVPQQLPPPSSGKSASKPSPVGTLPFGNPYQPGGYSPYVPSSPYSPVGPRPTGLRGDPTIRASQAPFYDRRNDINSYRQPGLQAPLVPPP